jgi:hypothetical protein
MNLVTILRELWRLRLAVAVVGFAAVLAAVVVAFAVPSLETRRYAVGVATARILVDTPQSQVLAVAPKGSETLGLRANLLAKLMVEGVVRDNIAKRAGLRKGELQSVETDVTEGPPSGSSARSPAGRGAHILKTQVVASTDGDLPIIEVEAQGPDAASAAKLANAAIPGLRDYLDSKAAVEDVPNAKRLRVTGLGSAQAGKAARGPGLGTAILVALIVFGLGCAAILVVSAVWRGWRAVSSAERFPSAPRSGLLSHADYLPPRGEILPPRGEVLPHNTLVRPGLAEPTPPRVLEAGTARSVRRRSA